jgi:DNA polymerase
MALTPEPRWSARQRAMLREMGLRAWPSPPGGSAPVPVAAAPAVAAAPPRVPVAASRGPTEPPEAVGAGLVEAAPERHLPRPGGLGAMDWEALAGAVAGCRACRLCDGRTQTVFGTGSHAAHWMVVGEAPGEQEDRLGEPFVGKSGQLLDAMLRALGLGRDPSAPSAQAVYIANAVKCRPPGNRNPQPDEMAACEGYLIRQVALLRPRMILAMGRFAVQSLLRSDEPIGRLRGRVHRYEGVPLVVTYHPAYLLRNPQDKARAWDDLCLARQAMLSG